MGPSICYEIKSYGFDYIYIYIYIYIFAYAFNLIEIDTLEHKWQITFTPFQTFFLCRVRNSLALRLLCYKVCVVFVDVFIHILTSLFGP